jgi:membrane glycosyltransferase
MLGVTVFAGFAAAGWTAVLWALPLSGGLLVAIPFCVITAHPRFGRWLRQREVAAIPEEINQRITPSRTRAGAAATLALQTEVEPE